jgi:myo-inositol 2-dehydrogenase / D-chiro-inositol 1-dehydrogenase
MSKPETTRRSFLKKTSLAAASAMAVGAVAPKVHAAGSDQMKIALIGCGGRGKGAVYNHMAINPNAKIVAIADAFEDNAQNVAKAFKDSFKEKVDLPADRVFSGFDAYKGAIDAGADLMLIATPPGFRPIHYKAAIEAGKNVFMEKPCCVDAPGYRSLMETNKLADEKGLKVGVGLQRHHQKPYLETIKKIKDGALGKLIYFRVYWNSGGVWNRRCQSNQTEMEYQMRNWYYFNWLCGDHINEQHIHNMDIGNWIMDSNPVEANGLGGRQVRKFGTDGDFGEIFDHHAVEFTYADGTKMFSQCRHIKNCWNQVTEHAYGTKGYSDVSKGKITDLDGKTTFKCRDKGRNPYEQEHIDLLEAITSNKPYNEGYNGAKSSMTAVLGRMASYSGKVVKWDDAVANGQSIMPEKFAFDAKPPVVADANGSYEHAVAMPGTYKPY